MIGDNSVTGGSTPATDGKVNNVVPTKPETLKPGFEIPSWANDGMPGMNWPAGVRNVVDDCAEETRKFNKGK
jgi:hypothetical protein